MKPIDTKPVLVGGFGKIAYGTQYHMGNRVYHSRAVSMGICASPVGNLGGANVLLPRYREKTQ